MTREPSPLVIPVQSEVSCFSAKLPGLQVAWDSTSLTTLKDCPRKYFYRFVLGYEPLGESVHLKFGILMHRALETYHRSIEHGRTHAQAVRDAIRVCLRESGRYETTAVTGPENAPGDHSTRRWRPWRSDHDQKNLPNLIRSVVWYFEHYEHDPLKTVILDNGKPAVELSFRFDLNIKANTTGESYIYAGHLDRLATDSMGEWVVDAKTSRNALNDYFFASFRPNNQMTGYSMAGKIVWHRPIRGVIVDGIQVCKNHSDFARGNTPRTETELQQWHYDLSFWLGQAELYAKAQNWPMNDTACGHYGGCPFQPICSSPQKLMGQILQSEYQYSRWNPLESR